jgi:hypothetical protein
MTVSCAIVQTGLLPYWIVDSTLTHVVAANPLYSFHFVGLFQSSRANTRLTDTKVTPLYNASVDRSLRKMISHANLEVRFLGIAANPGVPVPAEFRGNVRTFDNVYRQLRLILLTNDLVPDVDLILRLREDAGWYAPWQLYPVSRILFKNCLHWGGVNDKMWFGPAREVLRFHNELFDEFMSGKRNPETAILSVVRRMQTHYCDYDDIPVSDARTATPGDRLCWKSKYLCGNQSVAVPIC